MAWLFLVVSYREFV